MVDLFAANAYGKNLREPVCRYVAFMLGVWGKQKVASSSLHSSFIGYFDAVTFDKFS